MGPRQRLPLHRARRHGAAVRKSRRREEKKEPGLGWLGLRLAPPRRSGKPTLSQTFPSHPNSPRRQYILGMDGRFLLAPILMLPESLAAKLAYWSSKSWRLRPAWLLESDSAASKPAAAPASPQQEVGGDGDWD